MSTVHTFVFADLAGYSALTEAHGDEYAADVAADFVEAARGLVAATGAEEIKALGDALLIRSVDATAAIELARRLVCELGGRERGLGVRVGMHTGTAVERDGDWFGSAVNIAARVADAATSGEVILTSATRELGGAEIRLRPRGRKRLRNIAEPVELFALVLDEHLPVGRAIDPVCRMALDPSTTESTAQVRDTTYYFCSERCRRAFDHNPRTYVADRSRGSDHLLVSDEARARTARTIGSAFRRGRLDADELESRMALVWSARTRADLKGLSQDVPRASRRWSWVAYLWPPLLFRRLRRRA